MHMQYACMAQSNTVSRNYPGSLRHFVVRLTAFASQETDEARVLELIEVAFEKNEDEDFVLLTSLSVQELSKQDEEDEQVQDRVEPVSFPPPDRAPPETKKRKPGRPRKKAEPQPEDF